MHCSNCGATVPERARFCGACGSPLVAADPDASPIPGVSPPGPPLLPGPSLATGADLGQAHRQRELAGHEPSSWTRRGETLTCPRCQARWPRDANFCGGCRQPLTADPPTHRISPHCGQTVAVFVQPSSDALVTGRLERGTVGRVVQTAGDWAWIEVADHDPAWINTMHIVDLRDATDLDAQTTRVGRTSQSTGGPQPNVVLAALAGVGIAIAAPVDWAQGASSSAFKFPVGYLFDYKTTSTDPKLGYFVIGIGILVVCAALFRAPSILLMMGGALALGVAVLFTVQTATLLNRFHSASHLLDYVGAGAWIVGICGVVVLVSPWVSRPAVATQQPLT